MRAPRHLIAVAALLLLALPLLLSATCGDASSDAPGVIIETISPTAINSQPPVGGKPAAPSAAPTTAPAPQATPEAAGDEGTSATPTSEPPLASDGSTAPTEGRWIDVDVTGFTVRLMDGTSTVREIAPVGVGEQVDTGEYASTQTGLFHVNSKVEDLAYDPPYDTYISHWVGFDPDKANGFHSFLKDASGNVVDPGTGRISNGCIRTGEPDVIFAYAEVGMPVWVHW